ERLANGLAQDRLGQIEKANEILASIFRDLDPRVEKKGGPTLRVQLSTRLDQAAANLDAAAIGDPLTLAHLQHTLGKTQTALGASQKAIDLLTKAHQTREALLGADHPDTLGSLSELARAYHDSGQLGKAVPMYEQTLAKRKAELGADSLSTLASMNNLA